MPWPAMHLLFVCIFMGWTVAFTEESKGTSEQLLLRDLLSNYSINSRPVLNPQSPAIVEISAQLIRIDSVSEVGQSLRTKIHLKQTWTNALLTWNPTDYGGVQEIVVSQSDVWKPNLHLFNEASQNDRENTKSSSANTKIVLTYDGNNTLTYAAFYKSTCAIDVTYFPFDEQTCILEFGSWSQDERQLLLTTDQADAMDDRSEYEENGEWAVDSAVLAESKVKYRLNIRPHSTVKLTVELKRKFLYYMMNLVVPCAMIACMIFLVFVLPPKSGERISLGITVLLSMAIFQELSSEKLPSSSDNFPLLGIYYTVSMFEIGLAMCLNCLVLNFYHRNYEMPSWIRRFLLGRLANLLRVHVPANRRPNNSQKHLEGRYTVKAELTDMKDGGQTVLGDNDGGGGEITGMNPSDLVTVSTRNGNYTSTSNKLIRSPTAHRRHPSMFSFNRGDKPPKEQADRSFNAARANFPINSNRRVDSQEERNSHAEDWKIASRVLDRGLLAISVCTGVLSASIIFLQAKRFRQMFFFS